MADDPEVKPPAGQKRSDEEVINILLAQIQALAKQVAENWDQAFPDMRERDAQASPGRLKSLKGAVDRLIKSTGRYRRDKDRQNKDQEEG